MKTWASRVAPWAAMTVLAAVACFRLVGVDRRPLVAPSSPFVSGPLPPAVMMRWECKHRLILELAAGRRSLLETAAAFKAFDDQGPPCPGWVTLPPPPGVSADEKYCRMVIEWLQAECGDEAACSLEAELSDRLRDGTLRLPEP